MQLRWYNISARLGSALERVPVVQNVQRVSPDQSVLKNDDDGKKRRKKKERTANVGRQRVSLPVAVRLHALQLSGRPGMI
jgi:hypothetical protein